MPLPPPAVQQLLLMRASWLPKSPITPASLLGCFFVGVSPVVFYFIFFIRKKNPSLCPDSLGNENTKKIEKKEVTTTANMSFGLRRNKKSQRKAFTILIARVQNN